MTRDPLKRSAYALARFAARLTGVTLFGIRCGGREHVPREGGVLVCANHQSFFDPVLVGLACDRRLNYLARESLFRFAPFRWLIQFFDAIPLDREGRGMAGIKETLKRLKRGEMVLVFPEGTRTADGHVLPLKPGFTALARRGNAAVLPVGLDGAFAAWPRSQKWPALATIHIQIGEPLAPEDFEHLTDEQLVAELERRIRDCHRLARQGRIAATGHV